MEPVLQVATQAHAAIASVLPTESFKPLKPFHQQLQAFHSYSNDASRHVSAVHVCTHLGPEMHQCLIFDGDGRRLIGIEYIISERLFQTLPDEEKKYYHSHAVEVSCGLLQLVELKGVPTGMMTEAAEQPIMTELHKTYGKTIHTWQYDIHPDLPMGPPQLMMSYTDPSQLPQVMVADRDAKYGISTSAKAESRAKYLDADFKPDEKADQSMRTGKGISFEPVSVDREVSKSSSCSAVECATQTFTGATETAVADGVKIVTPPA